jgi:hypothetical protein
MPILSHPAFGPRTALTYITAGTLLCVWTAVWYFIFTQSKEVVQRIEWFLLIGLFLTGLTLVVIGLLLGPIGQAARRAELPPPEAVDHETQVQRTAAANPNPAVAQMAGAVPIAPPPVYSQPAAPVAAPTVLSQHPAK